MIDTLAIAKSKHPGAKLSLDALCSRYGIDRSHRVKHGALLDAELLTQLYIELTGGRQIGLGLAEESKRQKDLANMQPTSQRAERRPFMAPREHHATAAEMERHKIFIEGIKDPLWAEI